MGNSKEMGLSYAAGIIFAIGWWIWIDATVWTNKHADYVQVLGTHYIPGIVGTIALMMINAVSWADLNGNFVFGDGVSTKAKVWMFFSFILSFAALIAGIWIAVQYWFLASNVGSQYGGVAILIQNALIFGSALIYRFAKPENEGF